MTRVPAEDRNQVETSINGRRYRAVDGIFEMPNDDAKIHLVSAGYGSGWSVAPAPRAAGYRCPVCGFGSWFTTCRKCADKETDNASTRA